MSDGMTDAARMDREYKTWEKRHAEYLTRPDLQQIHEVYLTTRELLVLRDLTTPRGSYEDAILYERMLPRNGHLNYTLEEKWALSDKLNMILTSKDEI
jgi:hypothetical protein